MNSATTTSTPRRATGTPAAKEDGGNLGYKTPYKGGYFPVSPDDHFADLRDEIILELIKAGLRSSGRTTRSAPAARPRSTTSSTR